MSAVAGRVLLLPKGEYNASETYHPLDFVTYGSSSYVCKATTLGNLPTDTDYWQPMAKGVESPAEVGIGIGTCSTAASTVAKTAILTDYVLTVNGFVAVTFTNAVPANSTLNINSQGAKPIYYQGSAIVDQVIRAGYTATFAYDGTNYVLISVDKSAGHEIKNPNGTTMTQRSALKFEGAVDVTDDSTNDQTKIKTYGHQIKDSSDTAMTDRTTMKFAGNVDVTDDDENGQTIVTGKGHTVVDQSGTAQTQRNNLQFADAFLTDDPQNEKTIVENIKEVTLSELSQATERGMYLATDEESVPIGEIEEDYVEVVADGVKTYATLMNELRNSSKFDATKINEKSYIFDGAHYYRFVTPVYWNNTYGGYAFSMSVGNDTYTDIETIILHDTSSQFNRWENGTITPLSAYAPPQYQAFRLYYGSSSGIVELSTDARHCRMSNGESVEQSIYDLVRLSWKTITIGADGRGNIPLDTGYIPISVIADNNWVCMIHNVNDEWKITTHSSADFSLLTSTTITVLVFEIKE